MIGLGLASLGGLALEITLTRLFSVLFFYNYVFLLISLAILGISIGAALAHNRKVGAAERELGIYLSRLAWGAAGSVVVLVFLIWLPLPVDLRVPLLLAAMLPYAWLGALSAILYRARLEKSGLLYTADLVGGALGVLTVIWSLAHLGGMNTLLALPMVFGLAATSFSPRSRISGIGLLLAALFLGQNLLTNAIHIEPSQLFAAKPLTRQLNQTDNAHITYTRWDTFARIDVLENEATPDQRLLFLNGAAGSVMYRYPTNQAAQNRIQTDLGYFPIGATTPDDLLIIGPGGGKDILYAHLAGTRDITAVELSPGVVDVLNKFDHFNGDLASLPNVNLVVDEGRSYLRRSQKTYDMIYLSEVTSLSAELAGYMLAENYIYTTEAIHDYLQHLSPDGWLVLKLYDEFTLTRAFTTVVQALVETGSSQEEAVMHIVVVLDPTRVSQEQPFREPLLMIARQPLEPGQGNEMLTKILASDFIPVFVPHALEQGPLGALMRGQTTIEAMIAGFERGDIRPTTDNAPFFYEFEFGLPRLLRDLSLGLAGATAIGLIYLAWQQQKLRLKAYWLRVFYFMGLGIGFMLLEAGVIQRLSLFLGHPTYSLSVVLVGLLVGGGIGSGLSQYLWGAGKKIRFGMLAALVVTGLAISYAFGISLLLARGLHWPHWGRVLVSWTILLPLGVTLGMPFPSGIRTAPREFIPFAWGVNGLGTALGAVGAMTLALSFGFQAVMLTGGCVYLLVAIIAWKLRE